MNTGAEDYCHRGWMLTLNPINQAQQLAAEVVKRLGQLNLHRRELERKLHVANGFFAKA